MALLVHVKFISKQIKNHKKDVCETLSPSVVSRSILALSSQSRLLTWVSLERVLWSIYDKYEFSISYG